MRAFLAIPLAGPALDAFRSFRGGLVGGVPAVRWTAADSPHITLHFFGTITDQEAALAVRVLTPVLAGRSALELQLSGLGSFPNANAPRVLWWGVEGDRAGLAACALACRRSLAAAGFAVEERPFRPHCTLGRPRSPWPDVARDGWQRFVDVAPSTPGFAADEAVLFESVPAPDGVCHFARARLPLGVRPSQQARFEPLGADAVLLERGGDEVAR